MTKSLGTRDSVLLKGKRSKSYCMAVGSGDGPGYLNGEKRIFQTRKFPLLLKIG